MKRMIAPALLFSCLFQSPFAAEAAKAPPLECLDAEQLNSKVQGCEGNSLYGEAALSCMQKFRALVKDRTKGAAAQMKANAKDLAKEGAGQSQNFAGAEADYAVSQATLGELIEAGKLVSKQMDSYLDNIVFPEDFDAPEELIGDPVAFLDNSGCYSENRDGIENLLDDLDDEIANLEKAKSLSVGKLGVSNSREGLQNTINQSVNGRSATVKNPAKTAAPGAPAPTAKGGKQAAGASDLSGTKKAIEDARKGAATIQKK